MALIPCAYILLSAYLLLKYDILFFPKSPPGFSLLRAWQERKACALRSCFGSSFAPPVFPATGFGISRRILPSFITQYIIPHSELYRAIWWENSTRIWEHIYRFYTSCNIQRSLFLTQHDSFINHLSNRFTHTRIFTFKALEHSLYCLIVLLNSSTSCFVSIVRSTTCSIG